MWKYFGYVFVALYLQTLGSAVEDPSIFALGDFNRDGRRDLAVSNFGSGNLSVLINEPLLALNSVFPQIAVGGSYRTSVIGVNTGTTSTTMELSFSRSNGNPLVVIVDNLPASSFSRTIPPMGTVRLEASSTEPLTSGYAKLMSSAPLSGNALFKTLSGANITSEAGIGLSTPTKSFTVYIDNLNNAQSGYAIANSGTVPTTLSLILRHKRGAVLETKSMVLQAGQHIAEFSFQRFPVNAPAGFEGSIEFTSDQNVAAVALRYDNVEQDVFSTIPVLLNETATRLYFPQVADGGTYRTNFILLNPTTTSYNATLNFYTSNGTPLPLLIAGNLKTFHNVPLSAKGVARVVTDGTFSDTRAGWVMVESPLAIGGSSIFQTVVGGKVTSQAGVSSSPLALRFITYVESLGFAESGLAVSNPNNLAVTLTFNLRNSSGQIVATTTRTLGGFGHLAQFFTQLFPTGFGEFEGTLEVLSTAPVCGVALRYDNASANVFTTLSVIVIP